ncbi:MAG: hypothetical protein H6739_18415 [Alphaproteobacteria bacterium]|nr:hypothetical protein [Alphaproteobacteria bacterium]
MDCLTLEHTDLHFGSPDVGDAYGLKVDVSNAARFPVALTSLSTEGDPFEQLQMDLYTCEGEILPPNASCEIIVDLVAKEAGGLDADIFVTTDNPACDEAVISITASVQPYRPDGPHTDQGGWFGCASGPAGGQGTWMVFVLGWVACRGWRDRVRHGRD